LTLFTNCRPSNRTFRASSSTFFFLVVLLFGLALAAVPFIYSITSIHPSRACGPFRELDSIWDTVPRLVNELPHQTRTFLNFIGSLAFLVPLFALSSVVLLFLVVKSSGYTYSISQLKRQLHQEGRDKQFLVKKIAALNISSQ
ncbi:voltage-gated chloride channel TMC4-like, partial [Mustelus asterias]